MNDRPTPKSVEADVLILGGGIAGLSLALQLKNTDPDVDILIVEKNKFPVQEAAYKVGESTLPISARYFTQVLGLGDHIRDHQIRKFGIRFFGSADGNHDITTRPELGLRRQPLIPSFQLDRGRLENEIRDRVVGLGVKMIDDVRVTEVDLGDPLHTAVITHQDGSTQQVSGRYLVDASGRAAILKHKLQLSKPAPHSANAAWFRIADRIAIDDWVSDPEWESRVPGGDRWRGTIHLHGEGYWVWLIPLASGSTSIGLVSDPDCVPFERMRRFEVLMEWMHEHEPQLAKEIDSRSDLLQDFRSWKDYPKNCERLYSPDRWFITGDAGVFIDPLYSPGMELISITNSAIVDLISEERSSGVDLSEKIALADLAFKGQIELLFGIYTDQYKVFGSAEVTSVKVVWETLSYFGSMAPIVFGSDAIEDPLPFIVKLAPAIANASAISSAFHTFLRDWYDEAGDTRTAGMMTMSAEVMDLAYLNVVERTGSEGEIIDLISENTALLQEVFAELVDHVARALGFEPPECSDWTKNPEELVKFRLTELKRIGVPHKTAPPQSQCGVRWATDDDPLGATNDHMAAWPNLIGDFIYPEPKPVAIPAGAAAPF